jgi:hypothetical protein
MKTIKAILIAALIIYGCADVVVDNNYTSQSIKQNPDRRPVLVFDGNRNVYDCDSTIDYQDEAGNWYKALYQDGQVYLEFPYSYNPKGFITKSVR